MSRASSAAEAYVYGLPTVDMYRILHNFALDPASSEFKAPLNEVAHSRALADPSDVSIVAMNVDTPYSYCWVDLRRGPVVLTMPPIDPDRYMAAEVIDLYTYIVGYVSPRTHGRGGARVIITGPNDHADLPDGCETMSSPTDLCLVLIRTQLFGDDDLPALAALQDRVSLAPLSPWTATDGDESAEAPLTAIPPVDVRCPPTVEFLSVLDWMLRLMPVLPDEAAIRHRLAMIGVAGDADHPFHPPEAGAEDLLDGLSRGRERVLDRMGTVRSSAELFGTRAFFDGDYLTKAAGAFLGILGNAAEEYLGVGYRADACGDAFTGTTEYTITFAPDAMPPVAAFWSITVYDSAQHLYVNEIDRYVISSRAVAGMRRDPDGAVTILVQHERPAEDWITNWLPCPVGAFGLTFRTYLPGRDIRSGVWTAPPVTPIRKA